MRLRLLLLTCAFAATTAAQDPTFSADVKVVNVFATVRDRGGAIVKDLTKDDFVVEEDGKPQTIRYFSRESNLPLTIGLLLDTGASQRKLVEEERSASLKFFRDVLRPGLDRASVLSFDYRTHMYERTAPVSEQVATALNEIEPLPSRKKVLYEAVAIVAEHLMKQEQGRKAYILISDGVDFGSLVKLTTAIEYAQRNDVLIYSIRYSDPDAYSQLPQRLQIELTTRGKAVMERMAHETGGGYFEVSKNESLDGIYATIEEALRNQYSIGYSPPDLSRDAKKYRKIKVTVKRKDLIVQAREGYYP